MLLFLIRAYTRETVYSYEKISIDTNQNKRKQKPKSKQKKGPRIIFINLIEFLFRTSRMGRQTNSVGLGSEQPRKWEFYNSVLCVYLLILSLYKGSVVQTLFQLLFKGNVPLRQTPHWPSLLGQGRVPSVHSSQPAASEISSAPCCWDPVVHPTCICIFYILCMLTNPANGVVTLCLQNAVYGSWIHFQVGAVFSEVL